MLLAAGPVVTPHVAKGKVTVSTPNSQYDAKTWARICAIAQEAADAAPPLTDDVKARLRHLFGSTPAKKRRAA